jgi:hypothetical protein
VGNKNPLGLIGYEFVKYEKIEFNQRIGWDLQSLSSGNALAQGRQKQGISSDG